MIKDRIEQYLTNQFTERIINTQDFFFQKGQDALQKWMNLSINNEDKSDLEKLAADYEGLQKLAIKRQTINEILNLLFEIISYCDSKAKSKDYFNQYDDNRTLAMAYVRMNHWVEKLITFKFNPKNVPVGSIGNAINYLLDPTNNATILSENHRTMISKALFEKEYDPKNFITDLKEYFSSYQITVVNNKNYTYLLSCIIYSIKKEWLDDVIGLMAADNTLWKDNLINDMDGDDYTILWNSKTPTGTDKTLKMLRNKINDDGYFKLFYSVHGNIQYVAEIIDFAQNDDQLKQKNWVSKFKKIAWYQNDFNQYVDGNKSASIVFLAKNFYKINKIPANKFEVYKDYSYPRQDNLTPIISEPDIISISSNNNSTTSSIMNNNTESSLNQILYGPPGTGKTYKLQNEFFEKFTLKESSISRDQFLENLISELSWWQVISIALLDLKIANVKEIYNHEVIKIKEKLSSSITVRHTIWGQLQRHTILDCPNVNARERSEPLYFSKNKESNWTIDNELLNQYYPEAFDILSSIQNFNGSEGIIIKNYDFVTFHQSFSYEDFIEGIKPKLEDGETELSFEIKDGIFKKLCLKAEADPGSNYAIFIDEINRGNVSAIFGELITLIEEDKRLGATNELKIKLPYSKREFGVPSNLYIVGTMNTADRSVEALDTALRRRFCFVEMMPDSSIVQKKNFKDRVLIMEKINQRVELLLDRNYTLGHSYFIKEDFENSFKNEIIPLLQEYFYNDCGKIGLVLGRGFVREKEISKNNNASIFADFDTRNDIDIIKSYELIPFNEIDFKAAIETLLI
ncbi:AAA family ATPase [Flavobacterium sp. ANB]|uniref:McrB family protein n=1 Tax=unclassified Flavobacterium TaxID=196869 RepID=UPI0012BA15FD|nr:MULTISPECIES: AAA family ATPase [unclassified Flavobacterium]MBF4515579.1 AAA family ATPase [Flavobacterium sp. ANB]MTD68582.1 AAA domain-containing protein [Flavobacterium sp. LC2016-13]